MIWDHWSKVTLSGWIHYPVGKAVNRHHSTCRTRGLRAGTPSVARVAPIRQSPRGRPARDPTRQALARVRSPSKSVPRRQGAPARDGVCGVRVLPSDRLFPLRKPAELTAALLPREVPRRTRALRHHRACTEARREVRPSKIVQSCRPWRWRRARSGRVCTSGRSPLACTPRLAPPSVICRKYCTACHRPRSDLLRARALRLVGEHRPTLDRWASKQILIHNTLTHIWSNLPFLQAALTYLCLVLWPRVRLVHPSAPRKSPQSDLHLAVIPLLRPLCGQAHPWLVLLCRDRSRYQRILPRNLRDLQAVSRFR